MNLDDAVQTLYKRMRTKNASIRIYMIAENSIDAVNAQ